ncbi:MAG: hypothetical protein IT305_03705 [Chloroflexi bacterium]|nr:hypothetical protein [Chloroflexota bacterium]
MTAGSRGSARPRYSPSLHPDDLAAIVKRGIITRRIEVAGSEAWGGWSLAWTALDLRQAAVIPLRLWPTPVRAADKDAWLTHDLGDGVLAASLARLPQPVIVTPRQYHERLVEAFRALRASAASDASMKAGGVASPGEGVVDVDPTDTVLSDGPATSQDRHPERHSDTHPSTTRAHDPRVFALDADAIDRDAGALTEKVIVPKDDHWWKRLWRNRLDAPDLARDLRALCLVCGKRLPFLTWWKYDGVCSPACRSTLEAALADLLAERRAQASAPSQPAERE